MHLLRTLILSSTIVLAAGCASVYRTPGAASVRAEDLAVLEYNGGMVIGANIIEVDGKHRGVGFIRRYELTPGEHALTVALNLGLGFSAKNQVLRWNAVASDVYELKYDIQRTRPDGGTWLIWIEQKSTGRTVATSDGNAPR